MAQSKFAPLTAAALLVLIPALQAHGQNRNDQSNPPTQVNPQGRSATTNNRPAGPAGDGTKPKFQECGTVIQPGEAAELIRRHNLIFDQDPGPGPSLRGISYVAVSFHVIRTSAGTGGISHTQLCQGIADLNAEYANAGIVFYVQPPIDYIDDDDFYNNIDTGAEIDAMLQTNPVPDTVNVYCTPNLANENGGLCGRGSFTTSFPQGVAMSNDCMGLLGVNQSTFPHEVGHFFDLFHTHEDFQGLECVDGSNCATAGDLLCDTPADPNLDGVVDGACAYTGAATDSCNNDPYSPSTVNLMSYSTKLCRNDFTNNQDTKIAGTLAMFRPELIHSSIPASADCNGNEVPDFCEADCGGGIMPPGCSLSGTDCNGNGVDDACEIADALAFDCNDNFVPDDCELGPNDCNANGVPDDCDIAGGFSEDCQLDGIPDECQLGPNDCNGNGVPDICDIASGFSDDCNNNITPDECDVASGFSMDCQTDGVPDECQLGNCLNQYARFLSGGYYSDPSYPAFEAENFRVPSPTNITGFRWWGFNDITEAIHDKFYIEIRLDDAGFPAASPIVVFGPLEADVKLQIAGPVHEYTWFAPAPVPLATGPYWVIIYNDTSALPLNYWNWNLGEFDSVSGLPGFAFNLSSPNGPWNAFADNFALRVFCDEPDNDCNTNGVPDDCEIAAGGDCNNNMILDVCETRPDGDPEVAVEQDLCEDSMIVCPGFDYTGSNVGATSSMPFFCGLYYGQQDVFYRYRPAWDGTLFVRVEGPPIYWLYAIYDGCPPGGNEIKCNEQDHFQVVIHVEAGHDYYIRIASWGLGTPGTFEMNLVGPECALNPIDLDGNNIPDECDCFADVNNDGTVDSADVALVVAAQGTTCLACNEDINGDGVVDVTDWMFVLLNQGACPFP